MKNKPCWTFVLAATIAVTFLSAARAEDLDCNTRLPEHGDPAWSCVKASSFNGSCIPASAFQEWRCLELDVDATFCDDDQTFHTTVYLTTDNVGLDCAGQTIAHDNDERASSRSGFRAPYARSVAGIALRNCKVRDVGGYGIDLHRYFRGPELDAPLRGHTEISIENVSIVRSSRIGIYVGQASKEIAIDNVHIDGAHMGIYLESESTHTRISGATVSNSHTREGIAVDSSQHNLIEHSTFEGNAGGAIKMYQNCGEVDGQICPIRRPLSASYNTVRFNQFYDQTVELASRQFKTYGPDRCLDIGLIGAWRDHSHHNVVRNNYVRGTVIDVQDSDNVIYGNVLEASLIELGKVAPPGAALLDIGGIVAENMLSDDSDIVFDALPARFEDLELFNNQRSTGECWEDNACREATVWLGAIMNAGLIAVLL